MVKSKARINSSVSLAPHQPRSLRSQKRERPLENEISEAGDVQATRHHQDTGGNNPAVDATLLQCHQSPLQESTMISTPPHQAAEQSCLTKRGPAVEEKHAEARNGNLKNETVQGFEGQEDTTVTNPNNDSQLEGFRARADNDAYKNNEEISAEECSRPSSQTYTDQLQVFLPASEEGDGSCATALDEQLREKESSQCNLERNQETSQEEPSSVHMADVKELTKEAAAGLPAKKKRRMGMCGLTEKERSHFLQTQKRENGQNGPERVESRQICNNAADLVAQDAMIFSPPFPSSLSIPVGSVTEQNEAEIKRLSSHFGGDDRAESEVHVAVTTSDQTRAVYDPGCSKGKSCGAKGGIVLGPEQTDDTMSDPEEEEEELLGNQEQKDLEAAEIIDEKTLEQMKDGEDGSEVVDQRAAIPFYSNPAQNEETENLDAIEAALLQVNSGSRRRDEKKEELTGDAGDGDGAEAGASSTDIRAAGFNCGSVELCRATVTPSGSGRKDSRDPDFEPCAGPSTVNAEPPQTSNTSDPFGSKHLDYVSDSQLNTIALIEEEGIERDEDLGSSDCHEDATDLICGLIRELSSLNRKVMATHRELENLRRKSSRSSIR